MHLLYTRFFTKALRDIGVVHFGEPMLRLFNQGIILGPDSQKMSKSRGNVVNPDDYVSTVGADAVRASISCSSDRGTRADHGTRSGIEARQPLAWAGLDADDRSGAASRRSRSGARADGPTSCPADDPPHNR